MCEDGSNQADITELIKNMELDMSSSGDVTTELVQHILRCAEKNNSIVVHSYSVADEFKDDEHYGSCLCKVIVSYTKDDDPTQCNLSLIVKFTSKHPGFAATSFFVRETQMYERILPRMSDLLAHALLDHHVQFFPKAYFTRKDPTYVIALEDLTLKGFKAPKRLSSLDLRQSLLTLRAIARFHAASVMIRLEDESLFNAFDEHSFVEQNRIMKTGMMFSMVLTVVSTIVESWSEFGLSWADRLRKRAPTLIEDFVALLKRNDTVFNVLTHSDFGAHNLMFRYSESGGEVEAAMLIDFQCCSYNSPALDLQQLIFLNPNDEVRANHLDTMLEEYHVELMATLKALGAPPEHTISLTELKQEFDKKMLFGFLFTVCCAPLFSLKADCNLTREQIFGLIGSDVAKFQSLLTDSYISALKRLLPFFSKHNVF